MPAVRILVAEGAKGIDEIARFVNDDGMTMPLERTYPLERAAEALTAISAGHARGKIAPTVP